MWFRTDGRDPKTAAAILLLAWLCLLAFGGAWRCGFVQFDDDLYVFQNPRVLEGLTWSGAWWALTTGRTGNWHPLTWLSLMADTEWCGGAAWGFHAMNVVLHALNGVMLFLVLRRWTGRFALPWIAAVLWAVHPLRTESVVWISERKDVLAMFFGLLALLAYGRIGRQGRMAGVVFWFALSLLSKPTWVTLPFVLLLVDAWPLGRGRKAPAGARVREKWPLFLLSGLSCAATVLVQQAGGAVRTFTAYPLAVRMANAAVAAVQYLRAWVWPVDLAVFYPHPGWSQPTVVVAGSLAVLVLLTTGAALAVRRQPWWLTGWLWFLGTLVPMVGLVQVGGAAWADRYSYLPHIGLTVALVWGAGGWVEQVRWSGAKKGAGIAVGAVMVVLILLSRRQTSVWQDSETLFGHALQATERNAMARGALGFAYAAEGRTTEAILQLRAALEIQPDHLRALNNLAWLLATDPAATSGQLDDAVSLAKRAAGQVQQAKASGLTLEEGVEAAVMGTLFKAEERRKGRTPSGR